jgi:hypothetical protein
LSATLPPPSASPTASRRARRPVVIREVELPADLLDLYVLADRAQLWASVAPGLGHHLANALMSLAGPTQHPDLRHTLQGRLERAHHALSGMCESDGGGWPVSLPTVLADVDAWHRLQLTLPRAELRRGLETGLVPVNGGRSRLHHALLALVTLAKEHGATVLELNALPAKGGVSIELSTAGTSLPAADAESAPAVSRRLAVVSHLLASLGGRLSARAIPGGCAWTIQLPAWRPAS